MVSKIMWTSTYFYTLPLPCIQHIFVCKDSPVWCSQLIKCVHLPCVLAFQVFVLFSVSLVSFGMESPKRVVHHILHVLHDVDQREAYMGSLCVKRLAALLSPAIVPYIYRQLFVLLHSLCVYTMCLCVYVSWTAALAIQISPFILFVWACVCV